MALGFGHRIVTDLFVHHGAVQIIHAKGQRTWAIFSPSMTQYALM
jgi:hypothetical protein